ncbi:MAG: ABC transporter permease subunit [Chloroflexi bacterium]|nr:ABC transporter permease subunit [Chloroflexota bacterium]
MPFTQRFTTLLRFVQYFTRRLLTVGATVFVGVFLTVIAANQTNQLDANLERKLQPRALALWRERYGLAGPGESPDLTAVMDELRAEHGLNLPFLPRHLRYTLNALKMEWGDVAFTTFRARGSLGDGDLSAGGIILEAFPNTLLLVGAANLLIFLIGIPLALLLSRRYGTWVDRLFSFLAPISSIPAWVLGLLLILVFAVELRLLPVGGMRGLVSDLPPVARNLSLARHMLLPVAAIVLSQVFQLAYTWRSYLLVFANEDYVELAKAKGLTPQAIQRKYVLRVTYPFIITSFALTLVNFWQTAIALEIVFNWPGIGFLFIRSLPHYFGESMFPGEMVLTVGLVVLFAYILGATVLVLDFLYALVDPRIRLQTGRIEQRALRVRHARRWLRRKAASWQAGEGNVPRLRRAKPPRPPLKQRLSDIAGSLRQHALQRSAAFLRDLLRYPSAVVGLTIVLLLLAGSLYALVALPYVGIAESWSRTSVMGRVDVPRLAEPVWVDRLLGRERLSRLLLDSRTPDTPVGRRVRIQENGTPNVTLTFEFDYTYDQPPEEILVYFHPVIDEKRPFVFMTWTRPDGTSQELSGLALHATEQVNLLEYVFSGPRAMKQARLERPYLDAMSDADLQRAWLFNLSGQDGDRPLQGHYILEIQAMFFEPAGDLHAELLLLGQTYGAAGTDMFRRDLSVPLLWGMPFALVFGLLGAGLTVLVSMSMAALGVLHGGLLDDLIQRLADANLILPVLAISVLFYAYFGWSLWAILALIILLSAFGSPLKTYRSAFLQVIEEPYIESARTYGASSWRIIFFYMLPRVFPVILPQLIALIPGFVFLEATLGMFNIKTVLPTWGKVIYEAVNNGVSYGSRYWVLQPLALLLLTSTAFALLGQALDRILNPRLNSD